MKPSFKFIKNNKWFFFHKRLRSPLYQPVLIGSGVQDKKLPFNTKARYFGTFNTYVVIDMGEKERLADRAMNHLKKDPGYLLRLMNRAYAQKNRNAKQWGKFTKQNFHTHSNKQLAQIMKNYWEEMLSYGTYISLPLFFEARLEKILKDYLTNKFGFDLAQEYFHIIADPIKDGSVLEEEFDLLRLAIKKKVSTQELQDHQHKFCWMANPGYMEEYYPVDYYQRRLIRLRTQNPKLKLQQLLKNREHHRKQFSNLLRKIDDKYISNLVLIVNEAVYFRSFRTEMYYSSARFFTSVFKEIAKRLGLKNYKDVIWLYGDETVELLLQDQKADQKLIENRKKCFCHLSDYNGKTWKYDRKEAWEASKAYQSSLLVHDNKLKEVTGSAAFPGIAQGPVSLVLNLKELNKVRSGDILIAHSTNVNYVPALKKVKGLVTEEGGILSHAAIISREMKIPAVIGTKIATKIFKDGDMVEVDANKGIVRKIK